MILKEAVEPRTHLLANCKHREPDHESQLRPLIVEKAASRIQELGLAAQTQSGNAPVRTSKSERRLLISRSMSA